MPLFALPSSCKYLSKKGATKASGREMADWRWQLVLLALILAVVAVLLIAASVIPAKLKKNNNEPSNTGNSFIELTVTGPRGPTGAVGAMADTGATGPPGLDVNTGAAGMGGPTGMVGPPGNAADTGAAGATGLTGATGSTGTTGGTGSTGGLGTRGPTGLIGPAGAAGSPGAPLTLAPVGNAPNANAATYVGGVLQFQPASATFPGLITTGTQSFGGNKTFTNIVANNVTATNINATTVAGPTITVTTTLNATNILNIPNISSPNVIEQKEYFIEMRETVAQNITNNTSAGGFAASIPITYPTSPVAVSNWPFSPGSTFVPPVAGFYQITLSVRFVPVTPPQSSAGFYFELFILDAVGFRLGSQSSPGSNAANSPDLNVTAVTFFPASSSFTTAVLFLSSAPPGSQTAHISQNTSLLTPTVLSARFLYPAT